MSRPLLITCLAALCITALARPAAAQWSDAGVWDVWTEYDVRNAPAIYLQGNALWSMDRLDSSGVNTAGGFANNGSDEDESFGLGGAVGLIWDNCRNRVRPELEVNWHDGFDFTTNSFPGPPQVLYETSVSDAWSSMGNVWIDFPFHDIVFFYLGGGVGAMGGKVSVTDGVVMAKENDTRFGYQLGTGVILPIEDNMELDIGFRFFDPNVTRVGLGMAGTTANFGEYKAERDIYSVMISLRILLP